MSTFSNIGKELDDIVEEAGEALKAGIGEITGAPSDGTKQRENFVIKVERENQGRLFTPKKIGFSSIGEAGGFKMEVFMRDEGRRGKPLVIEGFVGREGELTLTVSYNNGARLRKRTLREPRKRVTGGAGGK